jgi:TonB-dependent SusC/RagA subfamily outer membrane receptor
VDGVVLQGGLQDLNPQDIESVEVVKGAAASSTYGSRAGGGVIQITTAQAKEAVFLNPVHSRKRFHLIHTLTAEIHRHVLEAQPLSEARPRLETTP